MKLNLVIILSIFFPVILFSQGEGNIWYFGDNAGLDFNSGDPIVVSGSLSTKEGCSTICDEDGNLLFYTDGVEVWNKNHDVMEFGTELLGDDTSSQSALIVKKPQSENEYFIFTPGTIMEPNGLNWSLVDMDLNDNLGAVVIKNQELIEGPISEKLAAISHSNQEDVWVVTHDVTDKFYCYLVTQAGVSSSPVITEIGSEYSGFAGPSGCLKFSPTGNKLATSVRGDNTSIEIFDFDKSSGIVSNLIKYDGQENQGNQGNGEFFGLEFSFDASKLYITRELSEGKGLYQFDLSQNTSNEILNSLQPIDTSLSFNGTLGTLQLGPDMKIYFSMNFSYFISVIHSPNLLGASCDFEEGAISLGYDKFCRFGLQNINQSIYGSSNSTSINESDIDLNTVVYPNPSKDKINISFENEISKIEELKIIDQLGRIVFYDNNKTNGRELEVNIKDLSPGIYYLLIKTETDTIVKSIVRDDKN